MRSAVAPQHICIYRGEYLPATMKFFHEIEDFIKAREPVLIDFSDCASISAAAAVMTFAKITRYQLIADSVGMKLGHQAIKIQLPTDKDVRNFFRITGFYDAIRAGGKNKLERLWNDTHNPFKTSNAVQPDIPALIKHLKTRLGKVPGRLMSALSEGYLNINHHAYESSLTEELYGRWWQYTTSLKPNGTFSVVLYDAGIGIPGSLENKIRETRWYSATDNQVIEFAMKKGNSRYPDNLGRGNGFNNIKQPVDVNKEAKHLLIASGKGSVTYKDQKIVTSEVLTNYGYGGTLIEWCFDGEMK
jgi:hypothetical protein